jgi:hypothetical protein
MAQRERKPTGGDGIQGCTDVYSWKQKNLEHLHE